MVFDRRRGGLTAALVCAAVPAAARAQTGTVSGRVVDSASQQGIPSVNVVVVGTTLGTQTRPDGSFTLSRVPAGAQGIRVARIGFRAQTRTVDVTGWRPVPTWARGLTRSRAEPAAARAAHGARSPARGRPA